ncbi:Armadillo-type fold [Phytophthora cactorum]|nr:Armadillo-type fold [Phytophthora cactorum]
MPAFQQQTIVDFVTAENASATQQQLQTVHNGRGFCEEASVKVLETYLAEQVQNKTVDIDASLALLKLYQVYPATTNAENVAKVLVKGVMALPSTFFTGASTMVPESIREDANVTAVLHTGFMLQSCLFEDFWKEKVSFAEKVPGFLDRSHSVISTEVFKAKLNVSDKEVAEIVAAEKWTVADNLIQINPNEDNQMQAKKDVLKVIHTLSR